MFAFHPRAHLYIAKGILFDKYYPVSHRIIPYAYYRRSVMFATHLHAAYYRFWVQTPARKNNGIERRNISLHAFPFGVYKANFFNPKMIV